MDMQPCFVCFFIFYSRYIITLKYLENVLLEHTISVKDTVLQYVLQLIVVGTLIRIKSIRSHLYQGKSMKFIL